MDSNYLTIIAVAIGAIVTAIHNIDRSRQQLRVLKLQHDWDVEDRNKKNEVVLGAIQQNTELSATAFAVGNNVNEKLLSMDEKLAYVIPDTAKILKSMIQGTAGVSSADVARVLVEMKRNADALELYSHESVHRLNNLLAVHFAKEFQTELRNAEQHPVEI